MQTTPNCLPCFRRQARYAAELSTPDRERQQRILAEVELLLAQLDLRLSPPENAVALYGLIARLSGCRDPFRELKRHDNRQALQLLPAARAAVAAAPDRLLAALRFALAGNIADFGAQQEFDLAATLAQAGSTTMAVNDYRQFREELARAETILYLGDNCGELVFDGLLLAELQGKKLFYAVKRDPVINDATREDGEFCGLERYATLIDNGTACPGTPLQQCRPEFRELFAAADLIISKGQGNFETLSASSAPLYFLLTVKCKAVAAEVAAQAGLAAIPALGELVLMRNRRR